MPDTIASVEAIPISVPRETPYLGQLEEGLAVKNRGYYVRPGNRCVYCTEDQSVVVKVTSREGLVGWGECFGYVVPRANAAIINELLGPFVVGRDPAEAVTIYHDLYDMMRVRGFFGGYYHDAIAAIDIALWDLRGKQAGLPLAALLGGSTERKLPVYVSGLPKPSIEEKAEFALEWQGRGFNAFKFATAVSYEGTVKEMAKLRQALGPEAQILCDMHWKHTAPEAIQLIHRMEEYDLALAEAPCQPEDMDGQARVAAAVRCPVAIGEELRTVYEFRPRFEKKCMSVIQPEMGRTGVTSFMEICHLALSYHARVMPHSSIGIGIYLAASLHASAAAPTFAMHEYQHTIVNKNLKYLEGEVRCEQGVFHLPPGPGLGTSPTEEVLEKFRIGN